MNNTIIYLGYNNFLKHKRGVENVIELQSIASDNKINYYIHWDDTNKIYRYKNFICIAIKKNLLWGIQFNLILGRIRRNKVNLLIHSHNPFMSSVSIYVTDILTVHDSVYYLNKNYKKNFLLGYFYLEKFTYYRSKFVHFISSYSKEQSLFSIKSTKFKIIHNSSHFESILANIKTKHIDKPFSKKRIKILVVRSIEDRARIDLIFELANQLNSNLYEIIVAGKGPNLEYYKNEVATKKLSNIQFLGYVDDEILLTLYQQCDLLLLTCEFGEGFGLPIIEAYMFNKAVLASNCCAVPEIIASKEFLFENNIISIKNSILNYNLLPDINFKCFYDNNYSNRIIAKQFNELYFNLFNSI